MLYRLKKLLGVSVTRPVFIIGTGRSGTHWLASVFDHHPEIDLTVEQQPMFGLSQQMALNPALKEQLFGILVQNYQQQLKASSSRLYIDKSHPNIWLAEQLKAAFSDALFIGIERNPYATVASMMRHRGVLNWQNRWREFPLPNAFLGITPDMVDSYDYMPIPTKCAMRWLAHKEKMAELQASLGEDLLVISYEEFQRDTNKTIEHLRKFLDLSTPLELPQVKRSSLLEWKTQLTLQEVAQIRDIVKTDPEAMGN